MGRHAVGGHFAILHKARANTHLYRRRTRPEARAINWDPMPRVIEAHHDRRIAAGRDDSTCPGILLELIVFEEFGALRVGYAILTIEDVLRTPVWISHGRCIRQRLDAARTFLARVAEASKTPNWRALERQSDGSTGTLGKHRAARPLKRHACLCAPQQEFPPCAAPEDGRCGHLNNPSEWLNKSLAPFIQFRRTSGKQLSLTRLQRACGKTLHR